VRRAAEDRLDLLLVCSSGGHLLQLLTLRAAWEGFDRLWVTEGTSDARSLLRDESVVFGFTPMHRNWSNGIHKIALAWFRNTLLAWRLMRSRRPCAVLTTGAALAVPFAWVAKLRGIPVVYVESISRIGDLSVSARLVARAVDRLYVQWPELEGALPSARYAGSVLARP
jgi:beta-1,4-N-acetylglucosaminyltransferase